MKKFKFPLNIYGVAIVVFLFAVLRLSHAIVVLTHTKTATKTSEEIKGIGTDFQQTLTSQKGFPTLQK